VPIPTHTKTRFGRNYVLAREAEPFETIPEGELQNLVADADQLKLGAIVASFTHPRGAPGNVAVRALNKRGEEALGDVHAALMTAMLPIGNVSNEKEPREKLDMASWLYDAAIIESK